MNGTRKMVAGLSDAALSALGSFLAGIVAVRELSIASLAVYAVLFSATVFAMVLPRQLHYIPSQIAANLEPDVRAPNIRHDARRAAAVTLAAFLVVVISGLSLAGRTSLTTCLAMGLVAGIYTAVSPIQDHVRGSLHLVDRHFSAAACSATVAITVAIGTAFAFSQPHSEIDALVPFASLLIGNSLSVIVGLALLRSTPIHQGYVPVALSSRGQFLLSEVAIQGAWFGCNYGILLLIGESATAHLEAARILASPVSILVSALITFMTPAMLRHLTPTPERPSGLRREFVVILGILGGAGVLYIGGLAIFGRQVSIILDRPLDLGLWSARIGEAVIEGAGSIFAFIVYAMGRTRSTTVNSVLASGLGLGGTLALAGVLGPFALPIGQAIGMSVRLVRSLVIADQGSRAAVPARAPAVV